MLLVLALANGNDGNCGINGAVLLGNCGIDGNDGIPTIDDTAARVPLLPILLPCNDGGNGIGIGVVIYMILPH